MDGKPYASYRTYTRIQAFSSGFDGEYLDRTYDANKAREIMTRYPSIQSVDFCRRRHNGNGSRYVPTAQTAIYVKAANGKWGHSAILRVAE